MSIAGFEGDDMHLVLFVLCFSCSLGIQIEMQVRYTSLEFDIEVWAGEVNLALINIQFRLWQ